MSAETFWGYSPWVAALNTGWTNSLAAWQTECDRLASVGASHASCGQYPACAALDGIVLLFRHGRLVCNINHTLARIHDSAMPSPLPQLASAMGDPYCLPAWSDVVTDGEVSAGGMRYAFWLRSSMECHSSQGILRSPLIAHCKLAQCCPVGCFPFSTLCLFPARAITWDGLAARLSRWLPPSNCCGTGCPLLSLSTLHQPPCMSSRPVGLHIAAFFFLTQWTESAT